MHPTRRAAHPLAPQRPLPTPPPFPARPLAQLRVAHSNGAATKLGKVKQVRKNIARVLTVVNQKAMEAYRKQVAGEKLTKVPKALRPKKTRAIRRALTTEQVRGRAVARAHGGLRCGRLGAQRLNIPPSPPFLRRRARSPSRRRRRRATSRCAASP